MRLAAALALFAAATVGAPAPLDAQRSPGWELRLPERIELVAGTGGTLPITLALDRGLSISKDAAIIVDLAPDSAIAIKRRRLGRADAVDPDADAPRYAIALRADTPGDYTIRVRVRFWVCGQKVCRPADAHRNVAVAVAAAPSPSPAPPSAPPASPPSP